MKASEPVVGLILAGGLAKRMGGGDKCLLPLAGKTLLQRTIERAEPQVSQLILNANGSSLRFARTRLPVIADEFPNNLGPLDGIHAGLRWVQKNTPSVKWMASFASDAPFFPADLVKQLYDRIPDGGCELVVASTPTQIQPIFSLWHISLIGKLEALLKTSNVPRLQDWIKSQNHVEVVFTPTDYDPFFNINTPQDLYAAEAIAPKVK